MTDLVAREADLEISWRARPAPACSVVLPVHDEAAALPSLLAEIETALAGIDFEVVAVDDASTDGSGRLLDRLAADRPWLLVVHHAANRGQTAALKSGLEVATAEVIVTMDSDGQNDPADIPFLLDRLAAGDVDAVAGRRRERKEGPARRSVSAVANRLLRVVTGVDIHDSGCALKAFRAGLLDGVELLADDHRFLLAVAGRHLTVEEVWVGDRARRGGRSHYGMERIPKVAVDLVGLWFGRRFRGRPLRAAGWCATALLVMWSIAAGGLVAVGQTALAIVAATTGASLALVVVAGGAVTEGLLRWRQ